jgi:hypothetical protein
MALGLSEALANEILDALTRNTAPTILPVSTFYVQLHAGGEPGAAGTGTVAGNATRKQVTFGTAADGGAIANTAAVSWSTSEVDTSEDYVYFSAWTAATSGTFLCSGTITANPVTTGDEFTYPVGAFDLTFTNVAS